MLRPFKVFFPKGDREQGLAELQRAMTKGQFVPTEVAYSLLQIHYVFEQDYRESLRYVEWLRARHPDNSLFHLYEARVYEQLGDLGVARRALTEILDRHAKGQSGYTDAVAERSLYLLARVEMRFRRFDVAMAHIEHLEEPRQAGAICRPSTRGSPACAGAWSMTSKASGPRRSAATRTYWRCGISTTTARGAAPRST